MRPGRIIRSLRGKHKGNIGIIVGGRVSHLLYLLQNRQRTTYFSHDYTIFYRRPHSSPCHFLCFSPNPTDYSRDSKWVLRMQRMRFEGANDEEKG